MIEEKISSGDLAKIIIFILVLMPFIYLIWGVIPCLLLLIGFLLAKRDGKLETLKKSITYCWYYIYLTIAVLIIGTIFIGLANDYTFIRWLKNCIPPFLGLIFLCLIFSIVFKFLYINPILKNHHLILKKVIKNTSSLRTNNTFSIADELTKLNLLKEKGAISEDDFQKMKNKILDNK